MEREQIIEGLYHIKNWKCRGDSNMHDVITNAIEALKAQLSQEGTTSDQHVVPDTNVGNNSEIPNSSDAVSRQQAIDEVCKMMYECFGADEEELDAIKVTLHELPSAQPEYEPVTAEDFAKTMSESTIWGFMVWYDGALALMKGMGFVICKKTI